MIGSLLAFELKYYTRNLTFYIGILVVFMMALLSSSGSGFGSLVNSNSPYSTIFHSTQLSSIITIFVVTVFAIYATLRDREYSMESLIFSSSIDKFQYLFTRFFGLVLSSTIVMSMIVLALFLMQFAPWIESSQLGEIRLIPYIWAIFVVIFPNVLIISSVIFATALFTKSTIFTYVAGLFIYCFYIIVSMLGNSPVMAQSTGISPENMTLAMLLDPYAYIAFYEQSHYWTTSQKNTLLPSLSGHYLYNRLLWVSVSLSIYAISYQLFKFRVLKKVKVKNKLSSSIEAVKNISYRAVNVSTQNHIAVILSKIKIEFITVIKGIPFIIVMSLLALVVVIGLAETITKGAFAMVPYYPHTGIILPILQEPISKIGVIIIILFSAELYWNERKVKIDELIDATKTKDAYYFLAKFFTISLIIITIISVSIVLAILFQLYHAYSQIDIALYLSLYYHAGLVLVLYAVFTFFMQNFVKNKALGIAASIIFIFGYKQFIAVIFQGNVHPLSMFAFQPEFMYSDMLKESYYANSSNWFNLYWSVFAFILSLLTVSFWKRGNHKLRFKSSKLQKALLVSSAALFISITSIIYYKMDILNNYQTSTERNDFAENYEKRYSKYQNMNLPIIKDVNLKIDLFPDQRKYEIEGQYILENKSSEEITELLISVRKQNRTQYEIMIPNASLESSDDENQMYFYRLNSVLKPGEDIKMAFNQTVIISEYDDLDSENYILTNGSYVEISKYIPNLGYDSNYEIRKQSERKDRGLPEYQAMMPLKKDTIFPEIDNWWNYEAIISTKASQSVVSQGKLIKEWLKDERRYFHYKSEKKMRPMLAFSSARYKREKLVHNNVEISLYYHPDHYQNIKTMMEAAKHTLDYAIKNFGPYEYTDLKMAELPDFSNTFGATAYPNTVYFVESKCFNVNQTDTNLLNVVYAATAHEIAHQWWAHQLVPAYMAGYRFQTETLAEYTELAILEEKYGREQVEVYIDDAMRRYTSTRRWQNNIEESLEQVQDQTHVSYNKGILAMNGIKGLLGENRVNHALKSFYTKYKFPKRPKSTDLISELYHVADSIEKGVINDYVSRTVFHDFSIQNAVLEKLDENDFLLTVDLLGKKRVFKEDLELSESLNENIEIAGYSEKPNVRSKEIFLEKAYMFGDSTRFTIKLNDEVKYLLIDPNKYRIEVNRADNLFKL
jgi:ABC-2 type transport system permease protein